VRLDSAPTYAGFWRRSVAFLLDSVIYLVLYSILFSPASINAEYFSAEGLLSDALSMFITVVLWVKFLGTPGKLLMGCQVVDADTFEPLTVKQAILRYLGYFVSMLTLFIGFLWIGIDRRKQGFHDKIANTVVLLNAGIEIDDESSKSLGQLLSEVR
jgi:uncharacterized RDD family membrane protein YckC